VNVVEGDVHGQAEPMAPAIAGNPVIDVPHMVGRHQLYRA